MHTHLQKPLLTRVEVAEVLGVSVQTVARMIGRGELEIVRVGERFVRITAESLRGVLNDQASFMGGGRAGLIAGLLPGRQTRAFIARSKNKAGGTGDSREQRASPLVVAAGKTNT